MRGMDKGSSRHVFIFFLTFYYLKQLLEKIAQTTGGMYVLVENMDELSTFFKRQVLRSRVPDCITNNFRLGGGSLGQW